MQLQRDREVPSPLMAPSFKLSSIEDWLKFCLMASQHLYNIYVCLVESPLLATSKVWLEFIPHILLILRRELWKDSVVSIEDWTKVTRKSMLRSLQWYVPKTEMLHQN